MFSEWTLRCAMMSTTSKCALSSMQPGNCDTACVWLKCASYQTCSDQLCVVVTFVFFFKCAGLIICRWHNTASASNVASITLAFCQMKKRGWQDIRRTAGMYLVCWRHLLKLMACHLEVPESTTQVWVTGRNKSLTVGMESMQPQEKKRGRKRCYHHVSENAGDEVQLQVPQDDLPTQLVQGRLYVCQGGNKQKITDKHTQEVPPSASAPFPIPDISDCNKQLDFTIIIGFFFFFFNLNLFCVATTFRVINILRHLIAVLVLRVT